MSAPAELIRDTLDAWAVKSSGSDTQYRDGGQWIVPGSVLPAYTQGGPGTGAAAVWRTFGEDRHRQMALQSIGWMLTTYQGKDGSIIDGITTMMFCQELGATYLLLEDAPHFQAEQADWWRLALTKAADYLISAGHVVWYANGNINCGYTLVLYLAARITGLSRFRDAYRASLLFTQYPKAPKWQAEGLMVSDTAMPAGYFTENSGYDTEYSSVQLDVLARLYVLSGDADVLRLVTLLTNQILPRVDRATWQLDTSGGTRHPQSPRSVPWLSPALTVLSDSAADTQWPAVEATFRVAFNQANPNFYRGLGCQLAVIALDTWTRNGSIEQLSLA